LPIFSQLKKCLQFARAQGLSIYGLVIFPIWLFDSYNKKPNWKSGWESIRPETYDRKPPEDELEGGIYELLQRIKWRNSRFYAEKYKALLNRYFERNS